METKIAIVGGGISGLAAAMTIERLGYHSHIYDEKHILGGRVATDMEDRIPMDHGFQVLLDAYPAVDEFLELEMLNLKKFRPGAKIRYQGRDALVGDVGRDTSFLLGTLSAGIGSLKDKWRMFTLSRKLKRKSINDIFAEESITTEAYLRKTGFSNKIIDRFFRPFYGGIFLEDQLQTSSRMFEFVFKMFAEGHACIPKDGIREIPVQMASSIQRSFIHRESKVERIEGRTIFLADGTSEEYSHIIVATTAGKLLENLPISISSWRSCYNLYFKTNHPGMGKALIGLAADTGCCVNNYHFLHDINSDSMVLSVTLLDQVADTEDKIITTVREHLSEFLEIEVGECLNFFHIKKALPVISDIQYAMEPSETQLTDHIFLAGDHLANASLNAAMLNGKAAAQAVVEKIENRVAVG